jgi:hypothetical protein
MRTGRRWFKIWLLLLRRRLGSLRFGGVRVTWCCLGLLGVFVGFAGVAGFVFVGCL